MAYFTNFPVIDYDATGDKNTRRTKNIFRRLAVIQKVIDVEVAYNIYTIGDGETPERVAGKFYGDPELHWTIMFVNKIRDPFYDWPLSYGEFIKFVNKKYSNPSAVHHYENTDRLEVLSTAPGATAVSNFTYEERLNDDKRLIKILKRDFVNQLVDEFQTKIKE